MNSYYTWHADAGHEWLEVSATELTELNGLQSYSAFSYRDGNTIYLEGDCDAAIFLQAKKDRGDRVTFIEKHYPCDAPLRAFGKLHQS